MSDDNEKELEEQPAVEDASAGDEQAHWKKKAEEYLEGWKRAKADYINFKKENDKNRQEMVQFANAALLSQLLPMYDHLKTACAHIPEQHQKENWAIGFIHIKNQFTEFFRSLGIEEIKTVGEKFNPEQHEAIDWQEQDGFEADTVYEESKPGYTLHGKVIVPAKVKVAK